MVQCDRSTSSPSSRREQVVEVALRLLEEHGPDGLTMRAVATGVGIKAPSLYKHFPDKEELETALIAEGFRQTAALLSAAIEDSPEPVRDLAHAYRRWTRAHPRLYRLMTHRPLRRELLPEGLEASAALPLVRAVGGDPDLARAAWALAHGLTSLELSDRFPPHADVDAAWSAGIAALQGQGLGNASI